MTIMVMKGVRYPLRREMRRMSVSEVKAKLSEALRGLDEGPTVIQSRGREVGVLISVEQYTSIQPVEAPETMRALIDRIDRLKKKMGGGVDFRPRRVSLSAKRPFGRS